jgi:hypothetical protein
MLRLHATPLWVSVALLLVGGCAIAAERGTPAERDRHTGPALSSGPSAASIAGRWTGTWSGYGVMGGPRTSRAVAEFADGGRVTGGRLILDDVATAEIPIAVKLAGSLGVPVVAEVRGRRVVARHARGASLFEATFLLDGDRLDGIVAGSEGPARIVLTRER